MISLCAPGAKLEYMPTGPGQSPPLTLAACHPSWDDYLDLNETLAEMTQHLIEEDGQLGEATPKGGAIPKEKDTAKIMVLHPMMIPRLCQLQSSPAPKMDLAPARILLT